MARFREDSDLGDMAKPKSDAYTGMLVLSLLAQVVGAVFLLFDYQQYPDKKPPAVMDRPAATVGPAQAGGVAPK